MRNDTIKDTIKRELPSLLKEDPSFRAYILELTRREYADKSDTQDRFYEILAELRQDREKQDLKWKAYTEEQNRKWDEQNNQWKVYTEEQNRKWDEQNRKWDEQNNQWKAYTEEQNRKWDEQNSKWDEQNSKWDANQAELLRLHEEIMAQAKRHDRSIGALGSRWGMQSEITFRNALAGILEQSFGVQVLNVNDYDEEGVVFGRPDQIELDVIIKNGILLICELKSSIDKAGMYIFERKARFYEKRHQRTANRLLVISPMIDPRAKKVAATLGIEIYSDSLDVEVL